MRLFLFWISFSFGEVYIRTIRFFMVNLPPPPFTMLKISYSAKNVVWYRCNNIVLEGKGGASTKCQKFLHLIVGFLSYLPPFSLFIQHHYFQSASGTWSLNNHKIQNIYSHCGVALTIKPMFQHKCKCSKLLSPFDPSSFNHPYWVGLTFSTNHDKDRPTLFPRGPIEPIALLPCCSVCIIKMCQTLGEPLFFWKFNLVRCTFGDPSIPSRPLGRPRKNLGIIAKHSWRSTDSTKIFTRYLATFIPTT